MNEALYAENLGFYTSGNFRVGKKGDFFTNVSVGPVFAELLGLGFLDMWRRLGEPAPLLICEQGAHTGQFAADLLSWLRDTHPDIYAKTAYRIIEPFSRLHEEQASVLDKAGVAERVAWHHGIEELPDNSVTGIFFSNELIDAFPTSRIVFQDGSWRELFVIWDENSQSFAHTPKEPVTESLSDAIQDLPLPPIEGYTTEICLQAPLWMNQIGRKLCRGFVITVDYGYREEQLYAPERTCGTLLCYQKHRRDDDPLSHPGEKDITAHVNFTALEKAGSEQGLETEAFLDQHHFLIRLAQQTYLGRGEIDLTQDPKALRFIQGFKTLMHPQLMGTVFKILVQRKCVESAADT